MSGTSVDGIDVALIETDGAQSVQRLASLAKDYQGKTQDLLKSCLGRENYQRAVAREAERLMTLEHAAAVRELLAQENLKPQDVDVIGFHGQTLYHAPEQRITVQIGDGGLLASETGIAVICDFRTNDVAAGGQGAPLLPLYHQALAVQGGLERPLLVMNLGGVANITYIDDYDLYAFDTGPANALMDDYVQARTGEKYDNAGQLASRGKVDETLLQVWLAHPYFKAPYPKSLDRNAWDVKDVAGLSLEDGLATLAAFTVQSAARGLELLPKNVRRVLVTGGGRHNRTLMDQLSMALDIEVEPVEAAGWDGDCMEAEGFAYLAVRSLLKKPISVPSTTGVARPMTGGTLHHATWKADVK